ncbi:MAG: HAD family phosphatase [Nanoarchaeota archaeon]
MKAVIFDQDGVILDSIPFHVSIWKETMREYGVDDSYDIGSMNGKGTSEIASFFAEKLNMSPEEIIRIKEAKNRSRIGELKLFPGARELIISLSKEFAVGLGTSETRGLVKLEDSHLHYLDLFKVWVCADDVQNAKPAPDIFLKVAEKLGVVPEECVVIEDAINGIIAAKAAGMKCIGLRNPFVSPEGLAKADVIVENLSEITTDMIKNLR